jgi:hypothetical protein
VAEATIEAAEHRLRELSKDPCIGYGFWLLVQLTSASLTGEFGPRLREMGVPINDDDSALRLLALTSDHLRREFAQYPESGPFAELTSLALRQALSDTVGQHTGALFESSIDDAQQAVRQYATPTGFGIMARRFFGDFMARTLRFFVDRELANSTGAGHGLQGTRDGTEFDQALDLYCRQSARILEDFGPQWLSAHRWRSAGEIPRKDADGFVAVALRKLRSELGPEHR